MPDVEIPNFSILGQLKEAKPIVMYCITMYQEDFTQFVQSLTGCIRSIMELKMSDEQKYSPDRFGIVLIVDGIDKLPKDFALELKKFNLFDEKVWYTATMTMNVNNDFVKKKFAKAKTSLDTPPEVKWN